MPTSVFKITRTNNKEMHSFIHVRSKTEDKHVAASQFKTSLKDIV